MAKIYNFEVENTLSEVKNELIEIILGGGKQKIGLFAPPKSGKSHFLLNGLGIELADNGKGHIMYGPTKLWGRDISKRVIELTGQHPILCNGDIKEEIILDDFYTTIASTPDSATRGIKAFKGIEYFQSYDEYHEIVSNSTYRRGLKLPDKYYNDPKCLGLLAVTGTPENLIGIEFDTEIYIRPKNRMIIPVLNLYYTTHLSTGTMSTAIEFINNQHTKDTKHLIRLNDIEKAEKVLETISVKDKALIHSKQIGDDKEYMEELISTKDVEMKKITITTSTLDSGSEIWTNDKMALTQFVDINTDFANISQNKCRLRNGVTEVNEFINIPISSEPMLSLEEIKITVERRSKDDFKYANKFEKLAPYKSEFLEYECNNGIYSYKIDEAKVSKKISDLYYRELYSHPEELKKHYQRVLFAEIQEVNIREFTENTYRKVDKEIKEEKKALKEEIALKEGNFIEWGINNKHPKEIELSLKPKEEADKKDQWLYNGEVGEMNEFILSSDGKPLKKKIDCMVSEFNCTQQQALIKIKNGEYEEMIFKKQFIEAIRRYHIDPIVPTKTLIKYFNIPYYCEVYYIYISIQELNKGKIIRFRLGDTNIKKLLSKLEEWRKKRYLCKIEEDTLHKYLEIMFVLDKENRITSIKKYTDNN